MAAQEGFAPEQQGSQPGIEGEMTTKPVFMRADYRGSGKLAGKVALITGGDSGIGRAIAVHYAREGASVAIVFKPEEIADAELTRQLVEQEAQECLLLPGDLRNPRFCKDVVTRTVERYGKLNILVNNAAEQHPRERLEDVSDQEMESTFQTNVYAFFRVTRAALPHLHQGDSILNTTSVTSFKGSQQLVDYSATKGAITAFTRSLSAQLTQRNIRVNGVAPGPIWTPLIPATFPDEKVGVLGRDTPMQRAGQPSEVAPAYVFLASEDASYFTGQILHPNGGSIVNA